MPSDVLYHHGILGQHWGVRRFQKEDGTRTPLGEKHRDKIENTSDSSNKQAKQEKRERIKDTAKIGTERAWAVHGDRVVDAVKSQAAKAGKKAVISIIKDLPNAPMRMIKGFNTAARIGKKAIIGQTKGGVNLIKMGGKIARAGIKVARLG